MEASHELRVLGVDPGTRTAGWAVVTRHRRTFRLVACGAVRANPGDPPEKRLAVIHAGLLEIAQTHAPHESAVEEVFAGRNPKAALAVGQGRGVALAALGAVAAPVHSYAARVIKRAVTGNGGASKEQVARMVGLQLGLAKPPEPADITDACAVAITHLIRRDMPG